MTPTGQEIKNDVLKIVYTEQHSSKSCLSSVAVVCLCTLIIFTTTSIHLQSVTRDGQNKSIQHHMSPNLKWLSSWCSAQECWVDRTSRLLSSPSIMKKKKKKKEEKKKRAQASCGWCGSDCGCLRVRHPRMNESPTPNATQGPAQSHSWCCWGPSL